MRKFLVFLLLAIIIGGVSPPFAFARFPKLLFVSTQQTSDMGGETITFYPLNVDGTIYRIGTVDIEDPTTASTYNYHRVNIYICATEGSNYLIETSMPWSKANVACQANQFRGWSATDIAGQALLGETTTVLVNKWLMCGWSVTPTGGEDDGYRTGTLEEYEDDASAGKTRDFRDPLHKIRIPHGWFEVNHEIE